MSDVFDEKVTQVLNELVEKTKILYPSVSFNQIGWTDCLKGQCAGRAYLQEDIISLNKEVPPDDVESVVTHEFAHLVATKLGGYRIGHGKLWKDIMIAFGQEPKRCHHFDLKPARRSKRYEYSCKVCGQQFNLTTGRHKQMQEQKIKIRCDCQELLDSLSFSGNVWTV